ncbi:MAG: pyrroline-5-carboxylate reductase [Bradymonadales bacterium]|nr:MAG: pyrroline-5-carboxylate reductase [Bradymonadales bacterium]
MSRWGFIGLGKMGGAILKASLKQLEQASNQSLEKPIRGFDASPEILSSCEKLPNFEGCDSASEVLEVSDIVVVAVKPYQIEPLFQGLEFKKRHLIISVCAGIESAQIHQWSGGQAQVLRAMPNLGAQLNVSMTVFAHAKEIQEDYRLECETVFRKMGELLWVDESQMDFVTALSGSGPGYFFYWMKGFVDAALRRGFDEPTARLIVSQTCLASGMLAKGGARSLEEWQNSVATKGGTTEAGLDCLKAAQLEKTIEECLEAATSRSKELRKK